MTSPRFSARVGAHHPDEACRLRYDAAGGRGEGEPSWMSTSSRQRRAGSSCPGLWALIFVVMAVLGAISQTGIAGAGASDWLNWYIPIALIVVGMKFNGWYPSRVRESVSAGT